MNRELVAADLVIAGYGLAGAITAIAAHDAGAEVVLLEKSPHFGGNSSMNLLPFWSTTIQRIW